MFGGIVDISKGPGSPHTWSVQWLRLGVLQNGYCSLVFQFRASKNIAAALATLHARFQDVSFLS